MTAPAPADPEPLRGRVALPGDGDERVRALLGSRIARLLPELDGADNRQAAAHVHRLLAALAADGAVRVRAAVAEEVKDMDGAPRDLIVQLANDGVREVSGPILRLSPVLTDADLLDLLATPPSADTAEAIAGRPKLSAAVADAIAGHAEAPVIRVLLANSSATIREATLDALVGRAPEHADWHAPLVRRPQLSARAVAALADMIAGDLLHVLASRQDLDAGKLAHARERLAHVRERLAGSAAADHVAFARALRASGGLTEAAVRREAGSGDASRLPALLATAGGVPAAAVERAVELRSLKALVSLVWHCGFGAGTAALVQAALVQAQPDTVLLPAPDGGYRLSVEEMEWQLELLAEPTVPRAAA